MKARTALLLAMVIPLAAPAAEILGARIRFNPQRPFVNQLFDIQIDVQVTPGADLQDTQIEGLPDNTVVALDNLVPRERQQVREGNQVVDVLSFSSRGRALIPGTVPFPCTLRATLVERRVSGFFSHWVSMPRAIRFAAAALEIRSLPDAGRPEGFGGAVGHFSLTGSAVPVQVQPGDIVTLCWEVSGRGWLGDAALQLPDPGGAFKTYPPQESARETTRPRLVVRQTVIPLSTNAVRVGTASFPYFDPEAETYRTAVAGPFPLTFGKAIDKPAVPERRIDLRPNALPVPLPTDGIAARLLSVRRAWPLAVALVVAVLAAGILANRSRWLAAAAVVVVLGFGAVWQRHVTRRQLAATWTTTEGIVARLCPAEGSRALFDLAPGCAVTPLETAQAWVRVVADGREGWVPAASLAKKADVQ